MKNQKRWLSALLAVVMILSLVSGNGAALNAYAEEFDDIILSDTEPAETDETETLETETEPQESIVSETETEVPESETEPQESTALETEQEVTEPETEAADVSDAAGTISQWSWNDEEELLDPESHILALPGASAEQPAYFEDIVMLLPSSITADGEEISVTWRCDTYPEDGAYEGSYVFTAALPEGYALAEDAAPLNVTVELGGATLLATTAGIPYLDADGSAQTCESATVVDSGDAWGTSGETAWYVVNSNVTIASRVTVSGDVHLILAGGYTLTASAGINVLSSASLTIYGQEKGTGTLVADGSGSQAGIGVKDSSITINGGTVNATGGEAGAGIGGSNGNGSNITINGGTVTATSEGTGAGIGGGYNGEGSNITINGGTVTATSKKSGAGIGGGNGRNGSNITINGGTVTATSEGTGAGIGGGYNGEGSNITISGGTVTATGGGGCAGIGGAYKGNGSNITISGGTVTATGGIYGAGIGGGQSGSASQITISGSFVTAVGGFAGAAIGDGGSSDADGTELDESNFTNAVVLRQSSGLGSTMTGQVYGNAVLNTDAAVPSSTVLTVPEDTSLTLQSGMTLENSGTIYVDSELNFGGSTYGTLTGTGSVYYWLTVVGGSAAAGTVTYPSENGKTYAKEKASVTLAPDSKEGQVFRSWESSVSSVTVTNHSFTMPASPLTVTAQYWTAIQVDYLNYADGSFEEKNAWAIPLTSDMTALGMADAEIWYVVNSDVTIESRITVTGDVHLILADGCTLTASQGINVPSGGSLTIYGQESGTGALIANGGDYQAGIGGNQGSSTTTAGNNGSITINGGTVKAAGGKNGAGIGGGDYGTGSQITINGGTVTATGGGYGAGIGGGYGRNGSNITINGGTVMATGGNYGAGVGGGNAGAGSSITINGGTVRATGRGYGAGIGGGWGEAGSSITISGGTVRATGGGYGAGIGGGDYGEGSNITISGGTVTATGTINGAGIGGGGWGGIGSSITISGGFVIATGGAGDSGNGAGAAIGDGGSSGADGAETAESNFTNAVVLRQSGLSTMTGKVYGTAVLDTDATVPTDAVLTVPESTSLTLQSGMTLTNSGTIYVDSELNFGGDYGTLTGTDSVYYWLTVVDGSATEGTITYPATDGKTYAAVGAGVTLAPDSKEGQICIRWETSVSSVTVTNHSFTMPASILTVTAQYYPAVNVDYLDYVDGGFEAKNTMAIPLTADMTALGSASTEIWYVVDSNLTIESRITVSGDVHLILADGYTLTASQGINVPSDSSLTIYGQESGTGALTANGGAELQAGIGSNYGANNGPITINGGTVTATGGYNSYLRNGGAGIGNGGGGYGVDITINGGTVTAAGGGTGAGIGGGSSGLGVNITINGGTVMATGAGAGAGIGGGSSGDGVNITINGGAVMATGANGAAGIGGGHGQYGTNITIRGGTVTATGGNFGAGIGGGGDCAKDSDVITISGGFVTAIGGAGSSTHGAGAAIGGGGCEGGDVNTAGTEIAESNFTNSVVLRQSGISGSAMTGKVYGTAVLDTDATVPTDAVLTVPEDTSLTLQSGMTLTNSGTIYVDSELNFGGSTYGTLTGMDSVYYWLTVVDGSATDGTITYPATDGKTYAAEGAGVTLTPDSMEGETFLRWKTSVSGVTVTNHSFTMPASPLTVTAVFGDTVSVDIIWGAMSFTYTDGAWDPDTHTNDGGGWTDDGSGWFSVKNNGGKPVNVAYTYTTARTDISGSFTDGTDPVSEPVTLAVNETKKLWLILSGKPDGELDHTELGTVTVKITGGGE